MEDLFKWFCRLSICILLLIIINSIVGDFAFRAQYSFPKVTKTTDKTIYTYNEPIQRDLPESEYQYIKAKGEKYIFALRTVAEYSISALVVAKNSNFWFRDIMRNEFDDIALLDLGFVWGDLARDKELLYNNIKFKSVKTLGQARQLQPRCTKKHCYEFPWEWDYFNSHMSHTHIIPANSNVMAALLKIKRNDVVKLDGYLVDIYTDKGKLLAMTSNSRNDNNATSRGVGQGGGYGACEIMYVNQVQIGDKIYR